jgi:hypothetical protein
MNTKFDVGQRVTYPVVHTADGNITGIAVSKAGVARYAIGPKWYTEDDLKLAAEEKPDMGNPVTEPAESKPEPVKLYCVKSYKPGEWFTKGRTYETDCNDEFTADDGYHPGGDEWRGNYWLGNSHWRDCLFPLVRRPAKVGEWVYIERFTQGHSDKAKVGNIYQVSRVYGDDVLIDVTTGNGFEIGEFLVLDGYHGDPA